MRQKTLRTLAVVGVAVLTLIGCLMRYYQIQTIFDASGLPETGNPASWMLAFLSILVTLLCGLSAFVLPPHKTERALFAPNALSLIAGLLSGVCLAAGAILTLFTLLSMNGKLYQIILELCQLVAALCVLVAAWQRWKQGRSSIAAHAIICLWLVLTLLLNFKSWSVDPTIVDYCFRLFALICGMCAAYHVGAFCMEKGSRRVTAFWCLAGCFFSLVSAIGESWSWKLMAIGVCLWQFANAWKLFDEVK